jgi:hypothetical protein
VHAALDAAAAAGDCSDVDEFLSKHAALVGEVRELVGRRPPPLRQVRRTRHLLKPLLTFNDPVEAHVETPVEFQRPTHRLAPQQAELRAERRVEVPGAALVQSCIATLRLAPAWMQHVTQVRRNLQPFRRRVGYVQVSGWG